MNHLARLGSRNSCPVASYQTACRWKDGDDDGDDSPNPTYLLETLRPLLGILGPDPGHDVGEQLGGGVELARQLKD